MVSNSILCVLLWYTILSSQGYEEIVFMFVVLAVLSIILIKLNSNSDE